MRSFFNIETSRQRRLLVVIFCFSLFQFAVANEKKDTVVVLQKKGKDRRYLKNCPGENVLMVCAYRKHGLTVLTEKVGVELHAADQYTRKFSEGTSLLSFLINLESKNKNQFVQK
jgi:hypothetical protein